MNNNAIIAGPNIIISVRDSSCTINFLIEVFFRCF